MKKLNNDKHVMNLFGILPPKWQVKRLKYLSNIQFSGVDKKKSENEKEIYLCNYVDVFKNDIIDDSIDFMLASATEKEISKFILEEGDVIATKDSESPYEIAIPAYVLKNFDSVICGYHLAQLKPNKDVLTGKYLFRLFQSTNFNSQFIVRANGVTRFGIGTMVFADALVPIPNLEIQKQISNFLDAKISQLDSLISKKQELIKKLKEKRIALITQAVTKGLPAAENAKVDLDDKAPTKNSGIQWLGDIPQHWEVRRLRFLIKSNPVKSEVSNLDDDIEVSFLPMEAINEYGGISYENIKAMGEVYNGYTFFRNRDVLVAKITPCFENGKGTIANNLINEIGFGTTELHVMRANEEIDIEYLFYLSISDSFRKLGTAEMLGAGGQKRVPEEFIKNFKIGFPAIEEQEQIVSYLNKHLLQLDNLISLNQKSITKLEEYRIALITNAVTGKIDLSHLQTDSEINSEN